MVWLLVVVHIFWCFGGCWGVVACFRFLLVGFVLVTLVCDFACLFPVCSIWLLWLWRCFVFVAMVVLVLLVCCIGLYALVLFALLGFGWLCGFGCLRVC